MPDLDPSVESPARIEVIWGQPREGCVLLDARGSAFPSEVEPACRWRQTGGPRVDITTDGATAFFRPPELANTEVEIELIARAGTAEARACAVLHLSETRHGPRAVPCVLLGATAEPVDGPIAEGETILLDGRDSIASEYRWRYRDDGGMSGLVADPEHDEPRPDTAPLVRVLDGDSAVARCMAPVGLLGRTKLVFELTVTAGGEASMATSDVYVDGLGASTSGYIGALQHDDVQCWVGLMRNPDSRNRTRVAGRRPWFVTRDPSHAELLAEAMGEERRVELRYLPSPNMSFMVFGDGNVITAVTVLWHGVECETDPINGSGSP